MQKAWIPIKQDESTAMRSEEAFYTYARLVPGGMILRTMSFASDEEPASESNTFIPGDETSMAEWITANQWTMEELEEQEAYEGDYDEEYDEDELEDDEDTLDAKPTEISPT